MADTHPISAADLQAALSYDPDTGALIWRRHHWKALVGKPVTYDSERGYLRFRIGRRWIRAHKAAWAIHTAEWPAHMIDHVNGDRGDNRWANLRPTDDFLNQQNRTRAERGSKSGLLGVVCKRGKFGAVIRVKGKCIWLGTFDTPESAQAAYMAAKAVHHPHSWLVLPRTSPR